METRSLQANYLYSLIRIIVSSIVGLLIIAQANKALGPIQIGKVEYANTIINYFLMFSALGIPVYAIREVSKQRNDQIKLTQTVLELLIILFITTFLAYCFLAFVLFQFDFLKEYKLLLIILSSMILFTNLGAEWFFQGVEDQKYITIRYVLVRIIAIGLLYIFVNNKEDYLNYAWITVFYLCGSSFFNFYFILKKLTFSSIKYEDLNLRKHIKPILIIFAAAISVNIYLQLDNFLIGYLAGDKYLGYYSIANKLIRYVITFITVGGGVLLPRLSNLYEHDKNEYFNLLNKSYNFIILFSIPFSLYFYLFADNIVYIMGGKDFQESIITLKILSPLCIIIGIAYFIGYLVLIPQKREVLYTSSVIFSAFISLLLNFYSIKLWQHNGAAIVQIIAELLSVVLMLYFSRNIIGKIKLLSFNILKIVFASFFVSVCFCLFKINVEQNLILFLLQSVCFFGVIYLILLCMKEETLSYLLNYLKLKIKV